MPVCFKCGVEKPKEDFYKHPQMAAGHLGKCKECTKFDMYVHRLTNPIVQERERARSKRPDRVEASKRQLRSYRDRFPLADKAKNAVNNAVRDGRLKKLPCQICGATERIHGHHKDYAKPLDVIWLCARCHHRLHALFPELEGANKRPAANF